MITPVSRPLVIVCAGGFASEIASYVHNFQVDGEPMHVRGFVDDHRFETHFEGAPLIGGIDELGTFLAAHPDEEFLYVAAVGDNRTRAEIVRRVERIGAPNLLPVTVRHTTSVIGSDAAIGTGTCFGPGTIVTAHVQVGDHCILNTNSSISHGSTLGSFVQVAPGASICSGVTIEEGSYVGAGATVADDVTVGAWSVIGAGSWPSPSLPPASAHLGCPSLEMRRWCARHQRPGLCWHAPGSAWRSWWLPMCLASRLRSRASRSDHLRTAGLPCCGR